jgi:CheY-like chemotaxis protein
LAHELRNPLAAIANAVHLLRKTADGGDGFTAKTPKLLSIAQNQVGHLVRLVDDLLEVSRITSGKIQLKKQPVDLSEVVRQALDANHAMIESRRHEVSLALPGEPLMVDGDSVRLTQIFTNLFCNAAKYTPAEGRIVVSTERTENACSVRVKDTGAGIPSDMLSRVFDRFIQVDRTLVRSEGGIGLGLTLARRLAQLHGGDIEAHSEGVGRGSEFTVRLPLITTLPPGKVSTGSTNSQEFALRRVLVVDDDSAVAESLAMILEDWGVLVKTAFSGAEALNLLCQFKPQLALIDIGMPGMDGYETARRIRRLPDGRNLVLAALSGWGRSEDRKKGVEAGFDRHFVKPIDVTELEEILSSIGIEADGCSGTRGPAS